MSIHLPVPRLCDVPEQGSFTVSYRIFEPTLEKARSRTEEIALEQTVEIPRDIVPAGFIENDILAKVTGVSEVGKGVFRAQLLFTADSCGPTLLQLLNLVFGNTSLQKGVKVEEVELDADFRERFPGARFGISGMRNLCQRPTGGLICPVLKPLGLSVDELAKLAYRMAVGGADIVKEDHGLADQPSAPFKERVEKIAGAVARANEQTGGNTLYFPHLSGLRNELEENATFAKQAGASGLMMIPGLTGFDLVHHLSSDTGLALPIMTHPSCLGPHVLSSDTGFTHAVMFGTLQRLAGSDISIFPNVGGRFGFSAEECISIADACRDLAGIGKPIFPSPGGGMSPDRAKDMVEMYGEDVVYLLGGSLLRQKDRIEEKIQEMRKRIDSCQV